MECEEISLIKQSEKGTVHLVRERNGDRTFVRKVLKGQHPIYLTLKNCRHPYLPELYEVDMSDGFTTIIEEYIEGQSLGSAELPEKQLLGAVKELCSVLEFLHGKDIIHRDIKPSNIILAKDGHIRLIDFDAARMPKDDLEQDTKLLGTRGYAPPEQYGFTQTDVRADIYAFGITLKQLLGDKARKPRYRRVIQKCTNLNPDRRYSSVGEMKKALFGGKIRWLCGLTAILLLALFCFGAIYQAKQKEVMLSESGEPIVLPAPDNPHWDGETGVAVWGNVPESGYGDGEVAYHWRLYRTDTDTPPDFENDTWDSEGGMRGNGGIDADTSTYSANIAYKLEKNGFYWFTVLAYGDGVNYTDSPYAISDVFEFTGENAPTLPAPTGLEWKMFETDKGREYYATWNNLDDYEDGTFFDVTVYDKDGNYIMNNRWTKEDVISMGYSGIRVNREFLSDLEGAYRFTVEVFTSRPNEYKSFLLTEPIPEEYYSPWYYRYY